MYFDIYIAPFKNRSKSQRTALLYTQ